MAHRYDDWEWLYTNGRDFCWGLKVPRLPFQDTIVCLVVNDYQLLYALATQAFVV
jgi:hypothetical protein